MTFQATGVNGNAAYSLPHDPRGMPRIRAPKAVSSVRTFESTASFAWGFKSEDAGLQGVVRILRWSYLPKSVYDMLRLFYETSNTVTWNPQGKAHTGGASYQVKLLDLRAQHMDTIVDTFKDVELELQITGVV